MNTLISLEILQFLRFFIFYFDLNEAFCIFPRPNLSFWIGLSQGDVEGWFWADNTTLTWENWNTTDTVIQPAEARLCATASDTYPSSWRIDACTRTLPSLCQYEGGMKFYFQLLYSLVCLFACLFWVKSPRYYTQFSLLYNAHFSKLGGKYTTVFVHIQRQCPVVHLPPN